MPYIPTGKTDNVIKHTQPCEYCAAVVTSISQTGLRPAYRRHLKEHHKAMYEKTMERGHYRNYPASSKPPEGVVTKDDGRHYLACPYCGLELSSKRENLLPPMLTNHKRNKHEVEFLVEITEKRETILNQTETVATKEVPVMSTYYTNASCRRKYPAPFVARVPVYWQVDAGVIVKCCGDGKMFAYPVGKLGNGDGWAQ